MLSDFITFIVALLGRWISIMSGGVSLALYMGSRLMKKRRKRAKGWDVPWPVYVWICLGALLIASFQEWRQDRRELRAVEDSLSINRPVLLARLIIDGVTPSNVDYHFDVRNTGKLPAAQIMHWEKTRTASWAEGVSEHPRILQPGSEMRIDSVSPSGEPRQSDGELFQTGLTLGYSCETARITNHFQEYNGYSVIAGKIKEGMAIAPESPRTLDRLPGFGSDVLSKALATPAGTVLFWATNGFTLYGGTRAFEFDASRGMVTFKTLAYSNKVIRLEKRAKSSLWNHFFAASWATNGASLTVDGETASDPEGFLK